MRKVIIFSLVAAYSLTGLSGNHSAPTDNSSGESGWQQVNPYRATQGGAEIQTGQGVYNQHCARCHGVDARAEKSPAPDLRKLNRFCQKVSTKYRQQCLDDNDQYFINTVRNGKLIVGVRHMPVWEGVIRQDEMWKIQLFIELQARSIP